jgi:DNA-directed RNA polymerase sigma subunit (sigma70/sigma32)
MTIFEKFNEILKTFPEKEEKVIRMLYGLGVPQLSALEISRKLSISEREVISNKELS